MRWTLPSPVSRELQPTITVSAPSDKMRAGVAHIAVESLNPDNSFADLNPVTAALQAPSGSVTSTRLTQTAPGHYETDVPLDESGTYEVRLTRQDGPDTVTEIAGFSTPPAAELLHAATNTRLLARLSDGHWPLTDPAQALTRPPFRAWPRSRSRSGPSSSSRPCWPSSPASLCAGWTSAGGNGLCSQAA